MTLHTSHPVSLHDIRVAQNFGLFNVESLALACRVAGVPFAVACALMEKESQGRNIYGHDAGGVFNDGSDVTSANFGVFIIRVIAGATSNGVGPAQITWAGELADGRSGGFFRDMFEKGLLPWIPLDNMTYGLGLLALYRDKGAHSWEYAGTQYNGNKSYGIDFAEKVKEWRARLAA